jgi:electron transport complex protein RnfG
VSERSVTVVSLRTGIVLVSFTVIFTFLMALTYRSTRDIIAASEEEEKMKLVNEVLPAAEYDNALLADYVELGPQPAIGLDQPSRLYRAWKDLEPVALVFDTVAPDGYSGRIRLLVAVRQNGTVAGVRVTQHRETPGLGDYIDIRKDKNRKRPWITQFDGLGFDGVPPEQWRVRKDGGVFDQVTGATVSARAVANAVGRALRFAAENREKLFDLDTGSKF